MEWRLEVRSRNGTYAQWTIASDSWKIPLGSDEVKVKDILRKLRDEYPAIDFRVLKVLSW